MCSRGDPMCSQDHSPEMEAPFMTRDDVNDLKAYVQGKSAGNQAESTVLLHCTHSNLKARFFEIRLDRHVRRVVKWVARHGVSDDHLL